jgi:hypothetical protein
MGLGIAVFFFAIIRPICDYIISRKKDCDLEWKCVETDESKEKFLNGEIDYHLCGIEYRINPNQLNAFVKIFGDNDWTEFTWQRLRFKEKEDFVKYVSNFSKLRDVCEFNDKENSLWRWP